MKIERDKPSPRLRLAQLSDASPIAALLLDAFMEYKSLYTEGGFAATTPGPDQMVARLQEGPVWVALSNGLVAGTLSVVLKGGDLYLRGMAVLPAARGHAIGQELLQQAEHYATTHKCKRLFLSTTPFLSNAIRLYEQFGFRRTDEGPLDLFGTPLFTMEKILARESEVGLVT